MKIPRKKLLDKKTDFRDARLFIIATEGKETEKQYFSLFQNQRIKVVVLDAGEDNRSAPKWVLDRLDKFKDEYDLSTEDSLWLMFDVDRWNIKQLTGVCRESRQKRYSLAISNPCFELWLYLHLADLNFDHENHTKALKCGEIESLLRIWDGGYNKSNLNLQLYKDFYLDAITRAKALEVKPQKYWPKNPGTQVYKVLEDLLR
jgi:RloB-like protein